MYIFFHAPSRIEKMKNRRYRTIEGRSDGDVSVVCEDCYEICSVQRPECYKTVLDRPSQSLTAYLATLLLLQREYRPSGWCPGSDRTTRRTAKPSSISRSTWSCTPAMSTCPWYEIFIIFDHQFFSSQATYFDRDDVASYGFSAYFKKNSDEEREHAEKFIKYQNKRGGKVVFQDVAKPTTMEWGTPLDALEAALELEKTVSIYNF